eukprot:scaffold6638_cov76-Phaeocystis_antarctica.AAC.9
MQPLAMEHRAHLDRRVGVEAHLKQQSRDLCRRERAQPLLGVALGRKVLNDLLRHKRVEPVHRKVGRVAAAAIHEHESVRAAGVAQPLPRQAQLALRNVKAYVVADPVLTAEQLAQQASTYAIIAHTLPLQPVAAKLRRPRIKPLSAPALD